MAGPDYDAADPDDMYNDEYYDSCEEDNCDEFLHAEDGDGDGDTRDPLTTGPWRPAIRWKQLKIGDAIIDVSSGGQIKPHNALFRLGEPLASPGVALLGTPYRTYTVEVERGSYKTYYVHELVYHAFYGPPPDGYEVRHVSSHTDRARRYYSNRLGCLTICPRITSPVVVGNRAV